MGGVFKVKKRLYIFILLRFCGFSQNLNNIPNPSFEELYQCDAGYDFSYLKNWYNPNQCTPDLFPYCATWNQVKTHSGYNRVGIIVYDTYSIPNTPDLREYIANKFIDTLKAGHRYCFNSYIIIPKSTMRYTIDKFGVYFGNGAQNYSTTCTTIPVTPQLYLPNGVFINDTANWYNFKGIYTALGGETDLALGNFNDNANTNSQVIDTSSFVTPTGYIVIDDVSLHEMSINSGYDAVTCPQNLVTTIGEVNLDTAFKSYYWYDASGLMIDSVNSQITIQPNSNTFYVQEKRMCGQSLWDTVYVNVDTVCPVPPLVISEADLIIPNMYSPNGDGINDTWEVELGNREIKSFAVYNRWGVEETNSKNLKLSKTVIWDGHTTSGLTCSEGVYYYIIVLETSKGVSETYKGYISLIR